MIEESEELNDIQGNMCMSNNSSDIDRVLLAGNMSRKNTFNIAHQNIRSFEHNYASFSVLIVGISCKIDALVFTETQFTQPCCAKIKGYLDYHTTRHNRAGGVSVYIKERFRSTKVSHLSKIFNTLELCTVKVRSNDVSMYILGV